jgi:hypothetical protein
MATKETLHRLVDELPDDAVGAVELFLEFVLVRRRRSQTADPVLQAFMSAPEDDEPLTAEEAAAIAEAKADFDHGNTVSWENYLASRRAGS